jgi:hypothetical protein
MASTNQSDDNGFVKRGFYLFGAMALLVAVVLFIIFYNPDRAPPTEFKDLPNRPSAPGWNIRYNATIALLRRGSDQVPWREVREMLDEKQQLKNSEVKRPDGRMLPNESEARRFVIAALRAIADWKRKSAETGKNVDDIAALPAIREQIDQLAKSSIPELNVQAVETRRVLGP